MYLSETPRGTATVAGITLAFQPIPTGLRLALAGVRLVFQDPPVETVRNSLRAYLQVNGRRWPVVPEYVSQNAPGGLGGFWTLDSFGPLRDDVPELGLVVPAGADFAAVFSGSSAVACCGYAWGELQ